MSKFDEYLEAKKKHDKIVCQRETTLKTNINELMKVMDIFSGEEKEDILITRERLESFKYNEWIDVSPGVRFKRIRDKSKPLYFITEMRPVQTERGRAKFGVHFHDCKEIVEILEGELIEPFECHKKYVVGEKVFYPKNYKHKPYATIKSVYLVEFVQ